MFSSGMNMLIATIFSSQLCHIIFTLTSQHEHSSHLTIMIWSRDAMHSMHYTCKSSQGSSNWINIVNFIFHTQTLNKNIALTTCTDHTYDSPESGKVCNISLTTERNCSSFIVVNLSRFFILENNFKLNSFISLLQH